MSFHAVRFGLFVSYLTLSGYSLFGQESPVDGTRAQTQVISIGILGIRDESGANVAQLGERVTQQLRSTILAASQDLMPKILGDDKGANDAGMTIQELTELGRQFGVKLVVRGGILPISLAVSDAETKATVRLYVDLVNVESGAIDTIRVEGSDAQAGAFPDLRGADASTPEFENTPVGQALARAIGRLSEMIQEKALAAVSPAALAQDTQVSEQTETEEGTTAEETAPQDEAAQAAQEDLELQQLVADAQTALNGGMTTDQEMLNRISQGLANLQSSLSAKVDLLQKGESTEQIEQAISQQKTDLRAAIDAVMQSQAVTESGGYPAEGSGQGGDFLTNANNSASQVTSLIQQIKDLRALLWGASEEVQTESQELPEQVSEQPVEQPMEEVTGVVIDDGQPVEGAEVTDTESGMTTTTGPDGSYRLPIQPGILSKIAVKRGGQQLAANQVQVVKGGMNVSDFLLTKSGAGGSGIISSSAVGRARRGAGGIVRGSVLDPGGKPAAQILVSLPGVGAVRSNSKGEFVFMNVPAGTHKLSARQGGAETQLTNVRVSPKTVSLAKLVMTRTVRPLAPMVPLIAAGSGTALYGRVKDDQDKALIGVRVVAVREGSMVSVLTGRDGKYELRDLSPGAYQVRLSKPGFRGAGTSLTLRSNKREKRDFDMKLASPLVNQLRKVETSKQGTLTGKIKGTDNRALLGATIEAIPVGQQLKSARTRSGSDGKFKLSLREGRYEIRISQPRFRPASRAVNIRAGKSLEQDFKLSQLTAVTPRPSLGSGRAEPPPSGQPRTVPAPSLSGANSRATGQAGSVTRDTEPKKTIRPVTPAVSPGYVQGRVIDAKTGRPIPGATVSISGSGSVSTDSGGNYRTPNLSPKSYLISVSRSGYQGQQRTVKIESGRALTSNFSLAAVIRAPRVVIPRK
jgi:hypothetical protein